MNTKLLKQKHQHKVDEKLFRYLHDAINNLTNTINRFEIVEFGRALDRVKKDKELRDRLEARVKALDACDVSEIKEMWKKIARLVIQLISVNAGGWFFYLVPIFFSILCLQKLHQAAKALVSLPAAYLETLSSNRGPINLAA